MTHWYEAYSELARLLNNFFELHQENAGTKLFNLCSEHNGFKKLNGWFDKFLQKTFGDLESVDPIHVFACLNETKISHENKVARVNVFFEILGGKETNDDLDFRGCPSPFSIKIMAVRKMEEQKEIWRAFHQVYTNGRNGLTEQMFSQLKRWYGISVPSFTIFLFWINSEEFLPLDKNTTLFIMVGGVIDHKPVSYDDYILVLNAIETLYYRSLVADAYEIVNRDTSNDFKGQNIQQYFKSISSDGNYREDFKILGFRLLNNVIDGFKKVLAKDTWYYFYEAFDLTNPYQVKYDSKKDPDIFSIYNAGSRLKVNISAIVGKNGSGKSSIAELLYLCINNLSRRIFGPDSDLDEQSGLEIEIYYIAGDLFRILFENNQITWFKYKVNADGNYSNPIPLHPTKKLFHSFFYTVAVNYSHYALNSTEIGNWIDGLFHKNDAYQIPVVINPMRTSGIIDINNEKNLLYQRLLNNILGPEPELRVITDNGRKAETLRLTLDVAKTAKIRKSKNAEEKDIEFPIQEEIDKIINKVYNFWHIPKPHPLNKIIQTAHKYIYRKLASISLKYPKYDGYFDPNSSLFDQEKFDTYLKRVDLDRSHVTNKLKQAVNFLRFPHLKYKELDTDIQISILADNIQNVISENYPDLELRTIELIPPSFFKANICLDDASPFEALSSGEKQKINTVSSLVYHLTNINSVGEDESLIHYSYVNVLYDEAELYFHPEMQRGFIKYILNYLEKVELHSISALNFCFITHSPLMLSDIPQTNILFLKDNGYPLLPSEKIRTFGGNIHELLAESFFLGNSFVGEFARQNIEDLITRLGPNDIVREEEKEHIKLLIELVGEPFIRDELRRMFYSKFTDLDERQKLIRELQNRIKDLENA